MIIHLVRTLDFPKKHPHFLPTGMHRKGYQGVRNNSFSENFDYVLSEWSLSSFPSRLRPDDSPIIRKGKKDYPSFQDMCSFELWKT